MSQETPQPLQVPGKPTNGRGRIRTSEGIIHQIYSPSPESAQGVGREGTNGSRGGGALNGSQRSGRFDVAAEFMARLPAVSGFECRRAYIGLSKAGQCPFRTYWEYVQGVAATEKDHLGAWRGYLFERAVLEVLGEAVGPGVELTRYDGLVKGHTDGEINGDLLEIKSTTLEALQRIHEAGRIPRRHYLQVQAYLAIGPWPRAQVLYVPRDIGEPGVFEIRHDYGGAREAWETIRAVVEGVRSKRAPRCACGRCQGVP